MSQATTFDVIDEIFERLARSGEVPPYLPAVGTAGPPEKPAPDTDRPDNHRTADGRTKIVCDQPTDGARRDSDSGDFSSGLL